MKYIKDIPAREIVAGIVGHYAHGTDMSFGFVEITAGSNLPAHQHVHEQITYIIEGELDMIIGGEPVNLVAGMVHIIPSNTPHQAIAKTNCKLIDVFSPVRDDYR